MPLKNRYFATKFPGNLTRLPTANPPPILSQVLKFRGGNSRVSTTWAFHGLCSTVVTF
jgi:hypothetical protein